jgi:MFS family permease
MNVDHFALRASGPKSCTVSPLRLAAFRALWFASLVSFIGSFVQDIGERWLILDLTGSPLSSAMLATALTTAMLAAMLPAGVLADRIDRRRLIIWSQIAQATVAASIGLLALTHRATSAVLVIGAACAGLGTALGSPAWSALVTELVPREKVAEAITLNAVSFNTARAIGPAIGGIILGWVGAPGTFLVNAVTFVAVIFGVATHRPPERTAPAPQPMMRAFLEPFGHVIRDANIRSVFLAMVLFTTGTSFIYVLLAAFAKLTLAAGPQTYGLVIGAMGLGAVIGAILLKRLREMMSPSTLLGVLMFVYGGASIALSQCYSVPFAIVACVLAGIGWTGSFSSMSALVQIWTPNRLRARAIALYTMIHLSIWSVGAIVSGALAEAASIRVTILVGGVICVLAGAVTSRMPLPRSFVPA